MQKTTQSLPQLRRTWLGFCRSSNAILQHLQRVCEAVLREPVTLELRPAHRAFGGIMIRAFYLRRCVFTRLLNLSYDVGSNLPVSANWHT